MYTANTYMSEHNPLSVQHWYTLEYLCWSKETISKSLSFSTSETRALVDHSATSTESDTLQKADGITKVLYMHVREYAVAQVLPSSMYK